MSYVHFDKSDVDFSRPEKSFWPHVLFVSDWIRVSPDKEALDASLYRGPLVGLWHDLFVQCENEVIIGLEREKGDRFYHTITNSKKRKEFLIVTL